MQWGVVTAKAAPAAVVGGTSRRYALVPLPDALDHLRGQSLLSHQGSMLQRSRSFGAAAAPASPAAPEHSMMHDDDSSSSSRGNRAQADAASRRGGAAVIGGQQFAPVSRTGRMPSRRMPFAAPARPCAVVQRCLF
jgi:hypothetical protein